MPTRHDADNFEGQEVKGRREWWRERKVKGGDKTRRCRRKRKREGKRRRERERGVERGREGEREGERDGGRDREKKKRECKIMR